MNATQWTRALAVVAALAAGSAFGAGTTGAAPVGAAAGDTATTKNTADMDSWMQDYSTRNNGRITRKAYMDEMGRRWDAMDHNQQGLSPADVSRLTGKVDSNAQAPLTGTGVQPGNMGPGNAKGK